MNRATFHPLPALRADVQHPLDEVFSTRIMDRFPVRQINGHWWRGFNEQLPAGTRILIREDIRSEYQASYQLISTGYSYRSVIYVYKLDESGPEYHMTREEYFARVRAAEPLESIPVVEPVLKVLEAQPVI
jgi:hypothetical protein